MKTIIIDGNNLLHKIQSIKEMHSYDKQGAAFALRDFVRSRYQGKAKIVIVFDGHGKNEGQSVIYSGNVTADTVIREKIEQAKNSRELVIVSSDAGITDLAKVCGCEVIKSENFAKSLTGEVKSPAKGKDVNELFEKPDRSTKKEIEEFKKYFT
jgi:predicted RNA-binding protein with PIN domain